MSHWLTPCARCVIFERRHISGRNITAISTYDGGYTQAHELMTSRLRGDEESIRAARQEVTRLRSAQAQRHQAMQSAYARKRNAKIDRKDHSALDHHKWIEKQTDTASGAAYRQMNKRLERAQRTLDSINRSGQTLRRRHLDRHTAKQQKGAPASHGRYYHIRQRQDDQLERCRENANTIHTACRRTSMEGRA